MSNSSLSSIIYSTVLDSNKPVTHYHESAKVINGYQASILSREPSLKSQQEQRTVQRRVQSDPSRSAVAELRRLSTLSGKKDLSDLSIPTITENAEDVTGLKGRIRLQKDARRNSSRNWMDQQRKNLQAYEYLCHIGEAKEWIEACIAEEIEPIVELEESLRNGIVLAKLSKAFEPSVVRKIFMAPRLQFRHSDNINYFFAMINKVGLPKIFWFELTDLYEKKNIPRVIYCIHALSHILSRRGLTPRIRNLVGKLEFTEEQLYATQRGLDASGIVMPSFANLGHALAAELREFVEEPMQIATEPEETEEEKLRRYWDENIPKIIICQSAVRRYLARRRLSELRRYWDENTPKIIRCQSDIRRYLARRRFSELRRYWDENTPKIIRCQSAIRRYLARRRFLELLALYQSAEPFIVKMQAQARGWLIRREWRERVLKLEKLEKWSIKLQTLVRGSLARKRFNDRLLHFQKNSEKVIKIQSLYRAKKDGDAYRSLTMGRNPPIGTIKNFVHLLNDSDFDFEEEIELERARQVVIQRIRTNSQSEEHLNELDIKIALLVKNRITLDEVVAVANPKKRQRRLSQLNSPGGPLSLKSLDKESRQRLELYQQLFYLLQTQPSYLARLFFVMNKTRVPDKTRKLVEGVVLTLFGYAQNAREEFLLLKLFRQSILEELASIDTLQEFLRGNFIFMKLVVHYSRGAKERKFLRELLGPLVKQVMDDDYMDLETDPLIIHRTLINAEELRTGRPSTRPVDISQTEALSDPETRTVFIHHLQRLRKETDTFLDAVISSLSKMPYGIRYIALELKKALIKKFPKETEDSVMKVVGHLVYYRYLNPAIVAPEGFDVVEAVVSPMQRKNLAEISKMLNQIAVGRQFSEDNMYLQPLNEYVAFASNRFANFFAAVTEIQDPEVFFGMDEYNDLTRTHKPTIYISPYELFSMHAMIAQRLDTIAPQSMDPVRQVIHDLGEVPTPEDEQPQPNNNSEITLILTNRLAVDVIDNPADADINQLFVETKRYILSILRVQNGKNLLDILVQPVTPQDEEAYLELCNADRGMKRHSVMISADNKGNLMHDITRMKFSELKKLTLQNVLRLEAEGKIKRQNNYQDMLNAIAVDIRNKHRRRVQRQRELSRIQQTLAHLDEKHVYLDDQIKSYNDYIEACMKQLSTKKGKKSRLVLPFTRQYNHIRELQRFGRVPKFGSYKYTAQQLHEKGVLLSIDGYSSRQFNSISFAISCDELGIFMIEAMYAGLSIPGSGKMELRLEELLQSQFNNVQVMSLFDGVAKVNLNLLIYLINKKFFV